MVSTQCIYVLKYVGQNVSEKDFSMYLAFLIDIFKELHPEYFRQNVIGRRRKYPLEELLGLHFWGEVYDQCSCRQKADLCKKNFEELKVLISGQPEKSKINDFQNQEKELIKAFDNFIVEFCLVSGLVDGNEFVADGTFFDGYCNDFKALFPDEIRYIQEFLTQPDIHKKDYELLYAYYFEGVELDDEISAVINKLRDNINVHGLNLILQAMENDENYHKVMNKLEHMEENITKDSIKVSIVDPEAHHMQGKDKQWGFHYNIQFTTDTKTGVVVDHYVTDAPNDKNEARKIVDRLIYKFYHEGFSVGFDNGYWNIRLLIDIIKETCVELSIPDKNTASKKKRKNHSRKQIP